MQRIQIRDARDNGRFFLDNELVDVYGKQIGVYGIAVYTTLARYANHTSQECFPSYNTIGEALDISRNTVIAAVKKLEDAGLIGIEKRISAEKGNPTTTNIYTLLAVKKVTVDKQYPSAPDAPGGIPQVLPSAGDEPGLVQEVNHPSAPEVPELNVSNRTNLNKGGTTRPPKSEAVLIEEYFLKATTGSIGFMSAMQREVCKKLADEGMTVDRCQPGIDQTIAEMNDKHKTVGSIQLCLAAIYQLDPAKPKPTLITSYQKTAPFEAPKKTFNEEDQRLTPKQQQILDEKRAQFQADEAAAAERRERRRLEKLALAQPINEPIRLQA